MVANPKNPSTLIFWNDLENDERLKTCSLAAKGLWTVHMLSIAARSPEPGYVLIGDHTCRIDGDLPKLLARVAGESPDVISGMLEELVASGTASVDDKGRVYNRRMVRAHAISKARSDAGKAGAEATNAKRQKSGKHPSKDDGKGGGKVGGKTEEVETTVSVGDETENPDKSTTPSRQMSGNFTGEPYGKSPPSSLLHASDSGVVTTTESVADSAPETQNEPTGAEDWEPIGSEPPAQRSRPAAPAGRAQPIPPDYQPSEEARRQLGISRPDITPDLFERRMVEFRSWCLETNRHTHNPDATWLGFMVKTHAERRSNDKSDERSVSAGLTGFATAGSR